MNIPPLKTGNTGMDYSCCPLRRPWRAKAEAEGQTFAVYYTHKLSVGRRKRTSPQSLEQGGGGDHRRNQEEYIVQENGVEFKIGQRVPICAKHAAQYGVQ